MARHFKSPRHEPRCVVNHVKGAVHGHVQEEGQEEGVQAAEEVVGPRQTTFIGGSWRAAGAPRPAAPVPTFAEDFSDLVVKRRLRLPRRDVVIVLH